MSSYLKVYKIGNIAVGLKVPNIRQIKIYR